MYAGIKVTTSNNKEIAINSVELINLAIEVMEEAMEEALASTPPPVIPNTSDSYDGTIKPGHTFPDSIMVPAHIAMPKTLQEWLVVIHHLRNENNPERKGWWINIGGILHRIGGGERGYKFYADQYGTIAEISNLTDTLVSALSLSPEVEFQELIEMAHLCGNEVPDDPWVYAEDFYTRRQQQQLANYEVIPGEKTISPFQQQLHDHLFESVKRTGEENLRYAYKGLKTEYKNSATLPSIIKHRQLIQAAKPLDATETAVKRDLLKNIIDQVNQGQPKLLFKSPFTIVDPKEQGGASYQVLAKLLEKAYPDSAAEDIPWNSILANAMRACMRSNGQVLDQSNNILLVILTAWFVAEPSRNIVSTLTGLISLDLLESGCTYNENGHNVYTLKHMISHPDLALGTDRKVSDLCGNPRKLNDFGGFHPMTHCGSASQANDPPTTMKYLTMVRQKEGHIISDWLIHKLGEKNLQVTSLNYTEALDVENINKNTPKKALSKTAKAEFLNTVIKPLLKARIQNMNCQLQPGPKLTAYLEHKPLTMTRRSHAFFMASQTMSPRKLAVILSQEQGLETSKIPALLNPNLSEINPNFEVHHPQQTVLPGLRANQGIFAVGRAKKSSGGKKNKRSFQ